MITHTNTHENMGNLVIITIISLLIEFILSHGNIHTLNEQATEMLEETASVLNGERSALI